jgi:hypothetical protein
MVSDGIADEIKVEAETVGSGRLNLRVKIVKPEATENFVYALNWEAQESELTYKKKRLPTYVNRRYLYAMTTEDGIIMTTEDEIEMGAVVVIKEEA